MTITAGERAKGRGRMARVNEGITHNREESTRKNFVCGREWQLSLKINKFKIFISING